MNKEEKKKIIDNLKRVGKTYQQIGEQLGLSRQRVHQLDRNYKSTEKDGLLRDFRRVFTNLKQRCLNIKNERFSCYGARGIKCLWKNFAEFKKDMYKKYLIHIAKFGKDETSLDRIDNNGNYHKNNCHWATWKEQYRNRQKKI